MLEENFARQKFHTKSCDSLRTKSPWTSKRKQTPKRTERLHRVSRTSGRPGTIIKRPSKKCFSVKIGNTQERRRYSSFSEARTQRDRDLWDNITTTHDNLCDPNHHHTKSKRQAPWSESKIVHVDRNITWRRSSKEPGTLLSFSGRFTPLGKLMQKNHIRDVRRDGRQKSTCADKEWAR